MAHKVVHAPLDELGVHALELRPLLNVLDALPGRHETKKTPGKGGTAEILRNVHD